MSLSKPIFDIEIKRTGEHSATLFLSGFLDENARLEPSLIDESIIDLTIDFDGMKFVNSIGIKTWVNFVDKLEARSDLFINFVNCRKPITDCLDIVGGFLPSNAKLKSFYLPVYCNRCDQTIDVLGDFDTLKKTESEVIESIPKTNCQEFPGCRKDMELDYIPSSFLGKLEK